IASRSLWLERSTVAVENGYFSVRLGEETPFPAGLFESEGNLYLGIRIADDEELKPRQKITSVPFALRSAYADEAGAAVGELAQQIVPSGAVMPFDLEVCPAGWAAFEPARGRTIVGTNPVDPDSANSNKLSRRVRGERFGEESHTLTVEELPAHHHTGATDRGARMNYRVYYSAGESYFTNRSIGLGSGAYTERNDTAWPMSDHTHTFTTNDTGEGQAINLTPPSVVLLYCRKL
ncbi:MAG TPA: hypothetical protein VFQ61_25700, partial [Polyangiaceae bacterium]|nr:hypothetical protein [Polyangiaceae bacterium]